MADAIGYERSYYSRVENGKRGYDQAILEKLAEAHGCKPADLLSKDPEKSGDLDAILRVLSPADLVRVTEIARTLRDVSQPVPAGTPLAPSAKPKAAKKAPGKTA